MIVQCSAVCVYTFRLVIGKIAKLNVTVFGYFFLLCGIKFSYSAPILHVYVHVVQIYSGITQMVQSSRYVLLNF